MTDYAPPTGPPPPKLPEGWKAVWNDQYSEWFYVNIYTKKSQWEKPNEPVYPPGEAPEAPPSYAPPHGQAPPSSETSKLGSNNPYAGKQDLSEDEKLARQLQEEEEARARSQHGDGASSSYYAQSSTPQPEQYGYGQQNAYSQQGSSPYPEQSAQDKGKTKGGLLGKLLGKASGHSSKPQGYPPQQPGYGNPYAQPAMGGGYYGGQPGYYPQQGMNAQPPRRHGGGIGPGGAAALGVGGGLLGGMVLGEMAADAGDGGDFGGDGGDFGGDGGDFGGGDMGGDF